MKVAIYTRVSTSEQNDKGYSLEEQLDKLRKFCDVKDYHIAAEYIDGGYTGRNTNRPQYTEMMDNIDNWDAILVKKMDRLHRNQRNFMNMWDELQKKNKELIFLNENIDTSTATGRLMMRVLQDFAMFESELIGERVFDGKNQKAKSNGGLLGFNIPIGYDYQDGALLINKKEAGIVKTIFNKYLSGMGVRKITQYLNGNGISTKNNGVYHQSMVSYILKNPIYIGFTKWEHHINKGEHQPIIDFDAFKKAQRRIKRNGGVIDNSITKLFSNRRK